jgi:hypothetical protein
MRRQVTFRWRNAIRALRAAALLGFALLGPACSDSTRFTYVDVDVTVDAATINATQLYLVTACGFFVMGADEVTGEVPLPCRENNVPYHVGTFQWASEAPSGSLQFTVKLFDANRVVIGSGTSEPVPVMPGKHQMTDVLVVGVEPP